MRPTALLLAALAWLAAAPTAFAQVAPPGNSGVDQYVESVPASSGNRPVGPASSGGELRRSAARKLSATGADGRAAARALGATAPAHPRAPRRASPQNAEPRSGHAPRKTEPRSGHAAPAPSPALAGRDSKGVTLLKAAATGAGGGGIGLLLPILLIGTLVAAGAFALLARRWRTE